MPITTRFLSTGPRLRVRDHVLLARTSVSFLVCTLGLCFKSLEADPARRRITFRMRFLWLFWWTWEISFDDIAEIHYRYTNLVPFGDYIAADSIDCYAVVIERRDRSEVLMFRWIGQGLFANNSGLPEFLYWEDLIFDMQGTQKQESLVFFEALKAMIFPRQRPAWQQMAPAAAAPLPRPKPAVVPPPAPGQALRPPRR